MDIFEKSFQWIYQKVKKRSDQGKTDRTAYFSDHEALITTLVQSTFPSPHVLIRPIDSHQGLCSEDTVFLPRELDLVDDLNKNRLILFHQALTAGLLIQYPKHSLDQIRTIILERFPTYSSYFAELWNTSTKEKERIIPSLWPKRIQQQRSAINETEAHPGTPQAESEKRIQQKKSPERSPGQLETIDLSKEQKKDNPVSHSFEKLETLSEYDGGFRTVDDDDDLESNQDALNELNLNKVIRDQKRSSGSFRSDTTGLRDVFEMHHITLPKDNTHILLPEWDYRTKTLVPNFCTLKKSTPNKVLHPTSTFEIKESSSEFHQEYWLTQIRALVNKRKKMNRQIEGSEIDWVSCHDWIADQKSGYHRDPQVFIEDRKGSQDLALCILIDLSLSTDSWIPEGRVLDIETEALTQIADLLKRLSIPTEIAGTYSNTRKDCHWINLKSFHEDWNPFETRIKTLEPNGYTRLGPALRHASQLLQSQSHQKKLILLLTDGKPTDYDHYEGRYGIEDMRHAKIEAQALGIQTRAFAVESSAKHYFPTLFGANEYEILSDPKRLPEALFRLLYTAMKTN